MIVCYARGTGLGHLTRVRAALHSLGRTGAVTVLADGRRPIDPRVVGPWSVVAAPAELDPARRAAWVTGQLRRLAATEFLVDAFPAGLDGELSQAVLPPGTTATHLARRLQWERYRGLLPGTPLRFDRTWVVEPLDADHAVYLEARSTVVDSLELVDPELDPPIGEGHPVLPPGTWLVVHSGPATEVAELVRYARESAHAEGVRPSLIVVTSLDAAQVTALVPDLPPHRIWNIYPVLPLLPAAERVITAGGFNLVRQLRPWRGKHRMVPFPRRFDDQFARVAHARIHS